MKLSIIIPVFNEEKTIIEIIKKVQDVNIGKVVKEIVIVDDGSTDGSLKKIAQAVSRSPTIKIFKHEKNLGKGAAVKTGIYHATGEYIVIQDADLEYDPILLKKLLNPILEKKADVVYGTRLNRLPNLREDAMHHFLLLHYFGNRFLSLITSILFGQWITDMETCYKLFPRNAFKTISLQSRGFEFEPEITAKLLKIGYEIVEVPISTMPRGYDEGKKLNAFREGPIALWTLIKYRFVD